ncbi:N-acetyldiaminopimelate deacetylase [Evansella halocellulosilytica]|uniref:N-acetyldiaminopimelate deacetylase n=1 Tax=Evansella halocellulosilytica TaxID=2011013 RepID=UPI000BB9BB70|nr:N-acetyldiaminopimelate deacetylase [Evansella halocellulosilytica]
MTRIDHNDSAKYVQIRRDLHKIPERGFLENKTQAYLLNYIHSLPQQFITIETWRTGILVKIEGSSPEKTIGYRTDIDGLPITEETGLSFTSTHEGMMHACGHDIHMSIALGILTYFSNNQPKNHLVFIFQPAEEGPGGAEPMLQSEEFQQMKPDEMIALHIAPDLPTGTIGTKPGLLFANTSELFIDLKGRGGHAAYPHLANDMVVAASHLVTQLHTIVSRNITPLDSSVLTIGKIHGGTKQNIIAEHARVEGTIRTLNLDSMKNVKKRIENICRGIEESFECQITIDYGANYCQVYNDEKLTKQFIDFVKRNGSVQFVQSEKAMTGEDFGYFLEEIPGFMFWLGVNSESGLHSSKLNADEDAIHVAINLIIEYIER